MRKDYAERRKRIEEAFGLSFETLLRKMYVEEERSTWEIAEIIEEKTGTTFTARSITRTLEAINVPRRSIGDGFRLAMKAGRVKWAWSKNQENERKRPPQVQKGTRYAVLKRDGFRCVLCGNDAARTILEVDHIIAQVNGGDNSLENLRTLCHSCNFGKHVEEKEICHAGGFVGA